ncbi:hypothetical protein, partial [Caballeronia sp.]|uniref:hypothetical protein n=1 Tax=Caballeronia sp. TaxID=1931223 RepID=UPI00260CEDD2
AQACSPFALLALLLVNLQPALIRRTGGLAACFVAIVRCGAYACALEIPRAFPRFRTPDESRSDGKR